MINNLAQIRTFLIDTLKSHEPTVVSRVDNDVKYEVYGTVEAMQGKKKVDGIYFATVQPKPKDMRFYFFPLYTHREQLIDSLSEELKKQLKGKTCFHIKHLSEDMQKEISQLIRAAVKLYQKDGLLAQ